MKLTIANNGMWKPVTITGAKLDNDGGMKLFQDDGGFICLSNEGKRELFAKMKSFLGDEIPALTMPMLNVISSALYKQLEAERLHLFVVYENEQAVREVERNQFSEAGQISAAIKRIEEIKEFYSKQFEKA